MTFLHFVRFVSGHPTHTYPSRSRLQKALQTLWMLLCDTARFYLRVRLWCCRGILESWKEVILTLLQIVQTFPNLLRKILDTFRMLHCENCEFPLDSLALAAQWILMFCNETRSCTNSNILCPFCLTLCIC